MLQEIIASILTREIKRSKTVKPPKTVDITKRVTQKQNCSRSNLKPDLTQSILLTVVIGAGIYLSRQDLSTLK
jgi:hypothetical protein